MNTQIAHILARLPFSWGTIVSSLSFWAWHSYTITHCRAQRRTAGTSITLAK